MLLKPNPLSALSWRTKSEEYGFYYRAKKHFHFSLSTCILLRSGKAFSLFIWVLLQDEKSFSTFHCISMENQSHKYAFRLCLCRVRVERAKYTFQSFQGSTLWRIDFCIIAKNQWDVSEDFTTPQPPTSMLDNDNN